jgi:hypothetical protein
MAAPIFWSTNTFCFLDAWEFTAAVGHILRPWCREMLRFISIMSVQNDSISRQVRLDIPDARDSMLSQFWGVAAKCQSLRKLEVPIWYMDCLKDTPDQLSRLPAKLPKLPEIRLTRLLTYCERGRHALYDTWDVCCKYDHLVTHARCVRRLALQGEAWNESALAAFLRDTRLNFCVYVDTAIKTQFLGADINDLQSWRGAMQLAPGLGEGSRRRRITLPNGETTTVTFYNVPVSSKSRVKRTRFIMRRDRLQKSVNGQTHGQNEANRAFRTARREEDQMLDDRLAEYEEACQQELFAYREHRRLDMRRTEEKTEHEAQRSAKLLGPKEAKQMRRDRRRARKRG